MDPDAKRVSIQHISVEVADQLTMLETDQFKFLCSDIIPVGNLESMDCADLMQALYERKFLLDDRTEFLEECMVLIGRLDIANGVSCNSDTIDEFKNNLEKCNSTAGLDRFKILLFHLANNLTKDEVKKIVLYLQGTVNFPKGKMGSCQTGFDLMNILIKAHYAIPTKLDDLIQLTVRMNRMDLKDKITTYSDPSGENNTAEPKHRRNIQQESSGKLESSGKTKEIKEENSDRTIEPSDWTDLVRCIPKEKHYSFCFNLNIPSRTYKMGKDNLSKLLDDSFRHDFEQTDLVEAYKKLDLQESLSLERFLPISPVISSEPGNILEKYSMTSQPRGICLIINNKIFETMEERRGSDVDCDKLKKTFESFHFEVIVAENLTTEQMLLKLREVASKDHKNYNCFVCCILTHGSEGVVYGIKGHSVKHKVLTIPFKANKCKTLSGKPKLFFIQACQGRTNQQGTVHKEEETDDYETDGPSVKLIPNEADFLMAYSTVLGYTSLRSRSKGSWFIQNLCNVFSENARRFDLSDMLLMVNNSVSKEVGNLNQQTVPVKQVPAPLSTLRKKVFFLDD